MYCSINVVIIFELTQRDLVLYMYTPRLMNTKWFSVKLLKNPQGVESILSACIYLMIHYVDGPDTDIKTIMGMQPLGEGPRRLAPVSQLFNSSNAG